MIDDDKPIPHRSKKDRKKWCKGKPGIEHVLKCMHYVGAYHESHPIWRELVCVKCGKRLDFYFPLSALVRVEDRGCVYNEKKPDWVDC